MEKIKELLEAHHLSNTKIRKEKDRNLVSGNYSSENNRRLGITVLVEPERKGLIWFYCHGSVGGHSINFSCPYQTVNRSKWNPPSFKAFLEKMLKLIKEGKDADLRDLMDPSYVRR